MNEIDAIAADWAARLDGAAPGREAEAALDAWLAEDVRHVGAFARAQAMLLAYERDATTETTAPVARPLGVEPDRRRLLWGGGMAAGLAALVAGGFWMAGAETVYATALGERRTIPLKAGGTLTLNTDSRVGVRDAQDHCRITFEQGEILVQARNGRTTVQCGKATVSADRATFGFRKRGEGSVLTVFTGQVSVAGQGTPLTAGDRLQLTPTGATLLSPLAGDALERELAWRDGRIAFQDTTLTEAVAEFARYTATPIRLEGASVGARRVSGLFAADDPAAFARAVGVISGLSVTTQDGIITLSEPVV